LEILKEYLYAIEKFPGLLLKGYGTLKSQVACEQAHLWHGTGRRENQPAGVISIKPDR